MKLKVRVVDLDSTISDDSWRQWMIDPEEVNPDDKYHHYHIHCDQDRVINRSIVDSSPVPVVFLTARPSYYRMKTLQWLHENNIQFFSLLMRDNNDHSSSPQMKLHALNYMRELFEIERAYDDRLDIVQMYRENGVEAVLV